MSNFSTCTETTLCAAMQKATTGNEGKGLVLLHTVTDHSFKLSGVAYKTHANGRPLLLNCCPWCRGEPGRKGGAA